MPLTFGFLGLIVAACVSIVVLYNSLVRKRNLVEQNFAQIDVFLRRRHDLIQNLVETVKGYAAHEKTTLENVTKARTAATSAQGVADKAAAENVLAAALKSLFAVVESYPNLKADQRFAELQQELAGTENNIASARQTYNQSVMSYNIALESFPGNMVASFFNFKKEKEYLEISEAEKEVKEAPKVQF